jgi:transcriptional regulator GlxA family with amidase domain
LIATLPPLIHFSAACDGARARWIEPMVRSIALELDTPGFAAVLARLSDVVIMQVIRSHVSSSAWVRALADPQLGSALALIHQHPERPWTVSELAARVGVSRSVFARRFKELVGESPLHYLTRLRMHEAQRLLRTSRAGIGEIAAQVGYQTEPAFSRAFKRSVGVAPGAFRRRHLT